MRAFLGFIFLLFLVWVSWASFSTGGLYELKQFNPDYAHPNKSAAYLISKINDHESNGFWDDYHVKNCSFHMPNWARAEKCVRGRLFCDQLSPVVDKTYGPNKIRRDIFSDEFTSCWIKKRPSLGPMGWLHGSREMWRLGVLSGAVWLTGGFNAKGQKYEEWLVRNKGWTELLDAWLQEGH
ncbi:MAG: hypothetical protein HQ511_01720 [Rhodospirillales bacterium]|nr:hypothetical protein [Rhodospirillales bacterium]